MRDVVINLGHTAVAKVLLMAVQLVATTILARNLSANDYGIVGFATLLMAFLQRINGLGLTESIVRSDKVSQTTLDTAASLNLVFSISAFLIAQLIAPFAGLLLGSSESIRVVRIMAFSFLLVPLGFLPSCMLMKEMRFGLLRTPSVAGAVLRGVVAVTMALTGWKYWSLVGGSLVASLTTNGLLQFMRRVPFNHRFNISEAKSLLRFGVPLTASSLVTFALLNADTLFIGSAVGPVVLGYYTLAFHWASFGCTTIKEVVHSVLFPKFSMLQEDSQRMGHAYLRTLRLIVFGATALNVGFLLVAEGFLISILGKGTERWLPAHDVFQVLCIYGVIRACVETVGNPLMAFGESRLLLKANAFSAVFELTLLPFVISGYGILGVGWLVTVCYTAQCAFYIPFLRTRLQITVRQLVAILWPILLSALIGSGLVALSMPSGSRSLWLIGGKLVLFLLVFISLHEIVSRGSVLVELRHILTALLKNRRAGIPISNEQ